MSENILQVRGLTQQFKGVLAVDHINMDLEKGRIYGLIGTNGAGKSTVVNMISGNLRPTDGEILFRGEHIERLDAAHHAKAGIARTFQNLRLFGDQTVLDNAITASQISRARPFLRSSCAWCLPAPWKSASQPCLRSG